MSMPLAELLLKTKKLHLLYVEDNDDARKFTLEMLRRFFDKVTVAENGMDGFKSFQEEKFDLVFTDINMPKMSGIEMISKMREVDNNITVVVLSAHNEPNYYDEASQLNVKHYLAKPLSLPQLIETLGLLVKDEAL